MTLNIGGRSIRALIDQTAGSRPDEVFLIGAETGEELTFQQLRARCKGLAALFSQQGLEPRDKVAFLMDNGMVTAQLFLAAMYGGFVAVPLNVRAGAFQLSYMLEHCDAKLVFVEEQYRSLLQESMKNVQRPIRIIVANLDCASELIAPISTLISAPVPDVADVALLMYSSGSTGQPKAAIHTHGSVLAGAENAIAAHELSREDRSLLVLPLYHINAECVTLIPTLLSGGSVVVPHRFSVSDFWDWMDDYRCTWSALVPTIISELVNWQDPRAGQREAAFQRIRFFRSSSAPLAPSLHREFVDKFKLPLLQAMGSTEGGNVFSNPAPPRDNKIGSPGLPWGFETRIVDREGVDLPAGEAGEVLLRGAALMRGYYKDAQGTASVLDADGWLHTGDLAYRDEDGYFFVVGRSKELVIKGGVNIAPRQIDEVIESHPAVLEAAAVGIPDRHLGEDLVAFVVLRAEGALDENALLSFCEERLGHFKTPTWIRFAQELPKGPSGKVQRLKLVDLALSVADEVRSNGNGHASAGVPSGAIEEVIAATWSQLLGAPKVDSQSNFFALGGHSLLAIQCISRLREKLPVSLTLSDFFENGTVALQAALVRKRLHPQNGHASTAIPADWERAVVRDFRPQPDTEAIPLRDRSLPYPLSPGQERLWFLEQLNSGVPVYNEAESVRLRGELNPQALERALNEIVRRHEVLRSTIQVIGGHPYSIVHESWPLALKIIDLSARSAGEREDEAQRLLVDEPRAPYHLEEEPGIRTTLVKMGDEDHILILMMHHIIADWSSEGVFWRELSALYPAFSKGKPVVLPPLPVQHGDFATWEHEQLSKASFAEDLSFWEENLRGAPPLLDLPTDRPRPPVMSHRGARKRWKLDATLSEAVRGLSRRENASLFTIFSAALNTLLHRYSAVDDVLIGIPLADRDHKELENVIGFLLHVHVLRTRVSPGMTFRELLARTQTQVLDVYAHRRVPFDQVVRRVQPKRNPSYSPLFQVMLVWRDRDQQLSFIGIDGLDVEPLMAESGTSKFDLVLFATDMGNEIWLELEYSTDLFDEPRILRMFGHMATLLTAVAADAGKQIGQLPLLRAPEERQILVATNRTECVWPDDSYVHELIEERAKSDPDATALVFKDARLTYRELTERADQVASHLRTLGVGPGVLAGISVERSADMLIAVLGILKTGGAYLPLDPTYPRERLAFIIQDAKPLVIVTQHGVSDLIPAGQSRVVDLGSLLETRIEIVASNTQREPHSVDDLAYVLYTSGSTGRPKGVQIPHRALANLLKSMQREPGIAAYDRLLAVTTLSFDIAGLELFLPLISGACVVIAENEVVSDGIALSAVIQRSGATMMQATPATWRLLLEAGWAGDRKLKILCGGEHWPAALAHQLLPKCHSLWNMYGPTETTIWSSVARIEKDQPILIGTPIHNTRFYVLDGNRQPVPAGVPGELFIGGDGLALGYLHRPDLTAERFIADRFSEQSGARMFKTGDLVRRTEGGGLEFLHRIDDQVKVRGFRIELGEIEACLKRHPAIGQCAVVVQGEDPANQVLVAFVVSAGSYSAAPDDLRNFLSESLPSYMIPAHFVTKPHLPLTPNGKIDRKALTTSPRAPERDSRAEFDVPRTALEMQLARVWEQLLGTEVPSVEESFFDLGGHSLLAVRLVNTVAKAFNAEITIPAFLRMPNIAGMARLLEEAGAAIHEPKLVPLRAGNRPGAVLFLGSGVGICRLGQALDGPAVFATIVPFAVSTSGTPTLKGRNGPPGLSEVASVYVDLIDRNLGDGPCVLVGHSFTGLLAFEIAHQMQAKGKPIDMVVLLDAWARDVQWHRKLRSLSLERLRFASYRLASKVSRKFKRSSSQQSGIAEQTSYESLDEMSWETFQHVVKHALKDYERKPLNSRAVIFRARDSHKAHLHRFDPWLGWNGLFSNGLDVVEVPGDHSSLLLYDNLAGLASIFQQYLDTVIAEPPKAISASCEKIRLAAAG